MTHDDRVRKAVRRNQIEEMARIIREANSEIYPENYFIGEARLLYRAGYRRSAEAFDEIFAVCDEMIATLQKLTGFSSAMFYKYNNVKNKYRGSE